MTKSKGILYVMAGAASYGILATFVKLAYQDGYGLFDVLVAQYLPSICLLLGLMLYQNRNKPSSFSALPFRQKVMLILGGSSYGLTGLFYYQAVRFAPVSICIILLMQTIWLGVILEALLSRKWPSITKIMGILLTITGTLLAVDYWGVEIKLDVEGMMWGLAAAISYTAALTVSNRTATTLPAVTKSFYILIGSIIAIVIAAIIFQPKIFQPAVFWPYGIILSVFGTVLPPLFFSKGFPTTGIGLGSILISIEIPISVAMAYFVIHEQVSISQWMGVVLVLLAILLINISTIWRKN